MRVYKPLKRRSKPENDMKYLQAFFYYHKGHTLGQTAKKFGFSNGRVYAILRLVEDNFGLGAYRLIRCYTGKVKDRPDKEYLKLRIRMLQDDGTYKTKNFCYDTANPRTDLLEDFVKEELSRWGGE